MKLQVIRFLGVFGGLLGGAAVTGATLELDHPHPEHPLLLAIGMLLSIVMFAAVAALITEPWRAR